MTDGIQAGSSARIAGPFFGRAGFKARLADAVADRDAIAAERDAAVAERNEAVAALAAAQGRVCELERRLVLNSGNSHKPPSSDGFSKPGRKKKLRRGAGRAGSRVIRER